MKTASFSALPLHRIAAFRFADCVFDHSWFHATVQLEDTVGIAIQIKSERGKLHRGTPWTTDTHRKQSDAGNPNGGKNREEAQKKMLALWQTYVASAPDSELGWLYITRLQLDLGLLDMARQAGTKAADLGGNLHSPCALLRGHIAVKFAAECAAEHRDGCPDPESTTASALMLLAEAVAQFELSIQLDSLQREGWERLRALVDP